MHRIAFLTEPASIRMILAHIGEPTTPPPRAPRARAPPELEADWLGTPGFAFDQCPGTQPRRHPTPATPSIRPCTDHPARGAGALPGATMPEAPQFMRRSSLRCLRRCSSQPRPALPSPRSPHPVSRPPPAPARGARARASPRNGKGPLNLLFISPKQPARQLKLSPNGRRR